MELIGLFFLGIWAAGKAKQKGKNQYLWSLVPVGLYLVVYFVAYLVLALTIGESLLPTGRFALSMVMFIRFSLIPISFILSKFLLEGLFKRMADNRQP